MNALPHFDPNRCDDRHWWIRMGMGAIFTIIVILSAVFGTVAWNSLAAAQRAENRVVVENASQAEKVATVARDLAVEIRATNEFRGNIADNLKILREWMKESSQKQDAMNESLQRLVRDQEHKKSP